MRGFVQDIRVVFRRWRRNRTVTAAAILTLGVATGALSTAFGALNAVLFRPLPYTQPGELVALFNTVSNSSPFAKLLGTTRLNFAYPTFEDIRDENSVFTDVAAYRTEAVNLASETDPERVQGSFLSDRYFSVVGVQPAWGRSFLPEEFVAAVDRPVILSYALWQRHFGGRAEVLGRTVLIDEAPAVIVAVMPVDFVGMHSRDWGTHSRLIQSRRQPDLWTPFTPEMTRRPTRTYRQRSSSMRRWQMNFGRTRILLDARSGSTDNPGRSSGSSGMCGRIDGTRSSGPGSFDDGGKSWAAADGRRPVGRSHDLNGAHKVSPEPTPWRESDGRPDVRSGLPGAFLGRRPCMPDPGLQGNPREPRLGTEVRLTLPGFPGLATRSPG